MIYCEVNLLSTVEGRLAQRSKFDVEVSTFGRRCKIDFTTCCNNAAITACYELNLLSTIEATLAQRSKFDVEVLTLGRRCYDLNVAAALSLHHKWYVVNRTYYPTLM